MVFQESTLLICIAIVLILLVLGICSWQFNRRRYDVLNDNELPMIESSPDTELSGINYILDKMKLFRDGWSNLGGGGVVYRGTFLNQKVAIKAVYSQMYDLGDLNEISREAAMLVRVAHPNITRLHGISIHDGIMYLVTDFVPVRLEAVVEHDANYSYAHMLRLAREIFEAVKFMHSREVAHRDLKPDNILLTEVGEVRICDLGISQITSKLDNSASRSNRSVDKLDDAPCSLVEPELSNVTIGTIGTAPWAPPEASLGHFHPDDEDYVMCLEHGHNVYTSANNLYSSATSTIGSGRGNRLRTRELQSAGEAWDVFSLGMLMWYLWYGEMPLRHLKSGNAMMKHLHRGLRPPLDTSPEPPASMQKLIRAMWQQNPNRRLSMAGVLYRLDGAVSRDLAKRNLSIGGDQILACSRLKCREHSAQPSSLDDHPMPLKFHALVREATEEQRGSEECRLSNTISEDSDSDSRRRAVTRSSVNNIDIGNFFAPSDMMDHRRQVSRANRNSRANTMADHSEMLLEVLSSPKHTRASRPGSLNGQRKQRSESVGKDQEARALVDAEVVVEGGLHRCCSDGLWRKSFYTLTREGNTLRLVMAIERSGEKPTFRVLELKNGKSASQTARIVVGSGPNNEAARQPPGSCFIVTCNKDHNPRGAPHTFRAVDSTDAARWVSSIQRATSRSIMSFSQMPKKESFMTDRLSSHPSEVGKIGDAMFTI